MNQPAILARVAALPYGESVAFGTHYVVRVMGDLYSVHRRGGLFASYRSVFRGTSSEVAAYLSLQPQQAP